MNHFPSPSPLQKKSSNLFFLHSAAMSWLCAVKLIGSVVPMLPIGFSAKG